MYFISYTEHALINIAPNVIFQLENFCLNNFLINRLAYKVRRRVCGGGIKLRSLDCFLCSLQCLSHYLLLQIKSSIAKGWLGKWATISFRILKASAEKMQVCSLQIGIPSRKLCNHIQYCVFRVLEGMLHFKEAIPYGKGLQQVGHNSEVNHLRSYQCCCRHFLKAEIHIVWMIL